MITNIVTSVNRSGGIENSIQHHIKEENLHLIFGILRSQLYSNPILATIKESVQNALDAHVDAGTPTLPVRVTLPTVLDSHLKIRDFGKGMSDEDIQTLYSGYGDSGKRHTNDQIGGLGIGKFSSLSYTDSFTINSYQNGVVSCWNNFIDSTQRGKISKMGHATTNEPNGVEITVPIKNQDIDSFHQTAIDLFSHFPITPELVNATDEDNQNLTKIKSAVPILEGQGYKYFGNRNSKVIMGGMPYPIKVSDFNSDDLDETARIVVQEGVVLTFNIGDLSIAASRESINYDSVTKKKLANILNEIGKDFIAKGNAIFANCKTLWDAKCLYRTTFSHEGTLYAFRSFLKDNITYNGAPLNNTYFEKFEDVVGARVDTYTRKSGRRHRRNGVRGVQREENQIMDANPRYIVIENDLRITNGILQYITRFLQNVYGAGDFEAKPYDAVYVMTFADATARAEWMKSTKFDGPITLMSSLTKESLSKYYGTTSSTTREKNAKHTTKEFTLNMNLSYSRHNKNSDYFNVVEVNTAQDAGVYVLINSFKCQSSHNDARCYMQPDDLVKTIESLKVMGIQIPTIYAFKVKNFTKVSNNPKMVNIWTWMRDQVIQFFDNVANQEIVANWRVMDDIKANCPGLSYIGQINKLHIAANSELKIFCNKVHTLLDKHNNKLESTVALGQKYGVNMDGFKATFNIQKEFTTMNAKYPLLFALLAHSTSYTDAIQEHLPALKSYINMIDAQFSETAGNGAV